MEEVTPELVITQQEEHAYGFIIEVLTSGLYPDKFHVIREYVQNSFDAILAWRKISREPRIGKIQIKIAPPSILIYDDGTGMNRDKVRQYRYVGYSEKRAGEAVGFRGIGKLSGISVAEKLVVTTSPFGLAERYKLVFDAEAMLTTILALKATGSNIALNQLVQNHTTIYTEDEDAEQHYTFVELHNIKKDAIDLMEQQKMIEYLSLNVPVEFDPAFEHGLAIDEMLREHVTDYDTVSTTVNNMPVYKPFLIGHKPPQTIFVDIGENETGKVVEVETDEDGEYSSNLLAFCWYCEHISRGQFDDRIRRGLFYRVKNFTVGDNQLPRITLWKSTPERAFYFFGEIHICDPEIVPSSERAHFEQNEARDRLYKLGSERISRTLNRVAGASSDSQRAKDFIEAAEEIVEKTEIDFKSGQIPKETKFNKLVDIHNAVDNASKRLKNAPPDYQERGEKVITRGQGLIKQITEAKPKKEKEGEGLYDIKTTLNLHAEVARLYDIIIDVLKDEFIDKPSEYEHLLKRIHDALEKRWQIEGILDIE